MPPQDDLLPPEPGNSPDDVRERGSDRAKRSRWLFFAAGLLFVLLLGLTVAWLSRERIARDLISDQLEKRGISAQYEIESISPDQQVIRNLVIGDPQRPDLTMKSLVIDTRIRFGFPGIGRITLVEPELYATYKNGNVSFGSLDSVIFTGKDQPFRLPDLDLVIRDGRGLIESDLGIVRLKVDGDGRLRHGFKGEMTAIAPSLKYSSCSAGNARLYGTIAVADERLRFDGPVRIGRLSCSDENLQVASANFEFNIAFDQAFDGAEGRFALDTGRIAYDSYDLASVEGAARFTYRNDALTVRYDVAGKGIVAPLAELASFMIDGHIRSGHGFQRLEVDGTLNGSGMSLGNVTQASLADAQVAVSGSLAEPILERIQTAFSREARGSTIYGRFMLRRTGDILSLVIPQARVRGGSGRTLLAVSRLQMMADGYRNPRILANFGTGGQGLPQITGRMEQSSGGRWAMRVRMPQYQAGEARVALPELRLVQSESGSLGFAGVARLTGTIPGGFAEELVLPLEGYWSIPRGLALWHECIELRFDRLTIADLTITRDTLPLCPLRGRAILRSGPAGLNMAAGAPRLDLSGNIGEAPIRIESGPIGFAWPGTLVARDIDVALGPSGTASQFHIPAFESQLGKGLFGTFAGADVFLNAVPLDLSDITGHWRYTDDGLIMSGGEFQISDREQVARFQPLVARGASLRLAGSTITAKALLREPESGQEIVGMDLRHDLGTGVGHVDLNVDGVHFGEELQPTQLSRLALGIVANVQGVVRGSGRVDWDMETVTSSAQFSTDKLDFAAALGPVGGVSGTIVFTDLLGLVTAPDQRLQIASINPGIEVTDGELVFELQPDYVLAVEGARWPFLGGTLTLLPVRMNIGSEETLRYTLVIVGLDAARFVEQMDLANISATGTFDGTLPLVFEKEGGRVHAGRLVSRSSGGNISYVGQLTYEDLSPMANFAFNALRSLDYSEMTIAMDGALAGEIVTRVHFYGVKQGEGAAENLVTRRISRLPLQFNINLRAPFMQLLTSVRSFYDPEYVRDPRSLGLLGSEGRPVERGQRGHPLFLDIQPSASESIP